MEPFPLKYDIFLTLRRTRRYADIIFSVVNRQLKPLNCG